MIVATIAAQSRWRRLQFFLIVGSLTAFAPLSIDMYVPALPTITRDFGAGPSEVQLTLTTFFAGLGLGQLLAGPLSDALGRRRPLFIGLGCYAAASLLCAVAPSIPALVGLRLLQGLAGAAGVVIAQAIVRDLYSGVAAARYFSLLMLIIGLAPILAPSIGSQLLRVTSWRGVFLALTGVSVLVGLAAALRLRETLPVAARRAGGLRDTALAVRGLLRDRPFVGYALTAGLSIGGIFAYVAGSSYVFQDIYKVSPQQFGVLFSVVAAGFVIGTQVNRRLALTVPLGRLVGSGLVASAAGGLVLLAVVAVGRSLGVAGLMAPLFVVMSGLGLVVPNTAALALTRHPESAGTASALLGALQMSTGAVIAPVVGIAGTGSALPMAIVLAVLSLGAAAAFTVLARPDGLDPALAEPEPLYVEV
jgi:DHA1 family bicyclomycin/chloramphenicol resistance-like MFS transporter